MKIIQVISSLGNGGAEKMVVELSNVLVANNHRVVLCSFKDVEPGMAFPKLLSSDAGLVSFGKKPGFDAGLYGKLFRLIRREKPEVIHFHLDATLKYILPLIPFFPKVKFVHTIHSNLNAEKKRIFSRLRPLGFLVKKVSLVCISPLIQKEFESSLPFFRYTTVENGIVDIHATKQIASVKQETEALKTNVQTQVLLAVGRLDENKNQELMIRALHTIVEANVVLLILGKDVSEDQFYLKKLKALKHANMHFAGPKTNVADYLLCADAFVMSSLNEGMPISVLEAFAAGLPVLTSPAGGISDLVRDGENGFIAGDFSVAEMASVLQRFLDLDGDQKKAISKRNREAFLSQYTIGACAKNYMKIYTS